MKWPRLKSLLRKTIMTTDSKIRFDSPRLKQLAEELESGKEGVLENFWQEVKKAGIPFVEPVIIQKKNAEGSIENHEDMAYSWVTFLYEGDSETQNVSLRAVTGNFGQGDGKFHIRHLANSNVWYWTVK